MSKRTLIIVSTLFGSAGLVFLTIFIYLGSGYSSAEIMADESKIRSTGASSSLRKNEDGDSIWLIQYEFLWAGDQNDLKPLHAVEAPKALIIKRGRTSRIGMSLSEANFAMSAPNVVELHLRNYDLRQGDFTKISEISTIEHLNLDFSRFSLSTFSHLNSESIKSLRTDVNLLRDVVELEEFRVPQLHFLDIFARDSEIQGSARMLATADGIKKLSALEELSAIRVHGLVFDHSSFLALAGLPALQWLSLNKVCLDSGLLDLMPEHIAVEVGVLQEWPSCATEPPRVPHLSPTFFQELQTVPHNENWSKRAELFLSSLRMLDSEELVASAGASFAENSRDEIISSFEFLLQQIAPKLSDPPSFELSSAEVGGLRWVRDSDDEESALAKLNGAIFSCIVLVFGCDVSSVWSRGQAFVQ